MTTPWECLQCARVCDLEADDNCPTCGAALPCTPTGHKWVGRQMGGPPDMAESYEWVEYCDVCGMENPGSYDHDAKE